MKRSFRDRCGKRSARGHGPVSVVTSGGAVVETKVSEVLRGDELS
jgi:hypothetical protein